MEIDKKLANLIITSDIQDTWNYKCLSDEICDQRKWNLTLWSKINQLSAKLRRCLVPEGSPDCLIVSPEINSIISDDSEYCVTSTKYHAKNGLEFSGEITGRYRIYTNYNLPANILILGRESEIFGPNNDIKCVILKVDNIPTFNQEEGLKKTNDLNNEVNQYVKEARSCFGSVIDKTDSKLDEYEKTKLSHDRFDNWWIEKGFDIRLRPHTEEEYNKLKAVAKSVQDKTLEDVYSDVNTLKNKIGKLYGTHTTYLDICKAIDLHFKTNEIK